MLFFKTVEPKELNYWQIISSPGELTHGDLIVYISPNARENHCMLVDHTINVKDDAVVLQVVDSTQFPHKNDTRTKEQKGIGKGEITISKPMANGIVSNITFITITVTSGWRVPRKTTVNDNRPCPAHMQKKGEKRLLKALSSL